MGYEPEETFRINLVSMSDKKEFLPIYMSYRMELMGKGGPHSVGPGKEEHLSKFWNDTNNNYLIWFMKGKERIGFAAITLEDLESGTLEDITIFRDHRNKGNGMKALEEVKKFVAYRGLKVLNTEAPKGMNGIADYFKKGGFTETEKGLKMEIDWFRPG